MNINELDTNKMINNIKTSMEMENQFLNEKEISVLRDFTGNKMTMEDAVSTFKKMTF